MTLCRFPFISSNVVSFCVNMLKKKKKDCIKPNGDISKNCKMVSFSEIAVDCIPLTTTYDTEISPAVMYGMSAPLTV